MKFYPLVLIALCAASSLSGMYEVSSPLFEAIGANDIDRVKELLADSANASMINEMSIDENFRLTPLAYAFEKEKWEIATFLIQQGADVNCYSKNYTLLHKACRRNNLELVQLLLEKGAYVHDCSSGETPFALVADWYFIGKKKFDIASLLVRNGASILDKNAICLIWNQNQLDAKQLGFEAFKWALENSVERVKELCNHNSLAMKYVITNCCDSEGNTLLHLAANAGPKKLRNAKALLLLEAGANPNIANKAGLTPLRLAFEQDDLALFSLLIAYSSDVDITEILSKSLATLNKQRFVKLLTSCGQTMAERAIENHDLQNFKRLIEVGEYGLKYKANEKDKKSGNTLLHQVAAYKRTGDAQKDAELDTTHGAMVKFLGEKGAIAFVRNNDGKTPLDIAYSNNNDKVVAELAKLEESQPQLSLKAIPAADNNWIVLA